MAYTIASARAQVLAHLDDESGARFARVAGATSYVKLDRALRSAVDRCLDDYVKAGGDRFNEHVSVTTDTDGAVALGAYEPLKIQGVLYAPTGGFLSAIEPGDDVGGYRHDANARDLTLVIVRRFPIADTPNEDDLLLGASAGAARSWDAFDEWVCCRAAIQLGVKDDELRKSLVLTRDDLEKSVLGGSRNPVSLPWGRERARRASIAASMQWLWTSRTQTLQLVTGSN